MAYFNSEHSTSQLLLAIIISLLLASALNIYPLSAHMATFRPMLLVMTLIFWLLFTPRYIGVLVAFLVGLAADLLLDTRLGQQASAAVLAALMINVSRLYIKQWTWLTAWIAAALGLIAFQLSLWLLQYITQDILLWQSGQPLWISVLCWPLLLPLRRFTH